MTVAFTADGDGSTVRFEHGGWNPDNGTDREKFREWPVILAQYVALADAQ